MDIGKVLLVMMAGLGTTWAARTATEALFGVAPPAATLAQSDAATGAPAPAAAGPTASVPQLTPEEMAEELRRAQSELAGGKGSEELKEFRPTRPLAADLAIALPSDI